jgi:glycosyltransferase involved in cell wall biosynthesis
MKLLALATNPIEGASTRFRVEQWRHHLKEEGVDLQIEPFYPSEATETMYSRGRFVSKLRYFVAGAAKRRRVLRSLAGADIVMVHREAFPLGWPLFLERLGRFHGAVVYDYDDALFTPQRRGRGLLEWLENLQTPGRVMKMSDVVLAGNPFLADYARQWTDQVVLVPTCIDTDRFKPAQSRPSHDLPIVGWIGSHSTAKYLQQIVPAFERAAAEVPFELYVVGSSAPITARGVRVVQFPWSLPREIEDFQRCDVGVYPLWDDEWSRGKSGFKAIQFMACGVPVIATPVGVTRDIIQEGVNGLFASSVDEWSHALIRLLRDAELRRALGAAGRQRIEDRYSVRAQAPRLVEALRSAVARARAAR